MSHNSTENIVVLDAFDFLTKNNLQKLNYYINDYIKSSKVKDSKLWSYEYNIPDPFMDITPIKESSKFKLYNIEEWYSTYNPTFKPLGEQKDTLIISEMNIVFMSTVKDLLVFLFGKSELAFPQYGENIDKYTKNPFIDITNDYPSFELLKIERSAITTAMQKTALTLLKRANELCDNLLYFKLMDYLMDYLNFFTTGQFGELKVYCDASKSYIMKIITDTPYLIYPTTTMPIYNKWLFFTKVPVINMLFTNGRKLSHNAYMPACYQINHDIKYHALYSHKLSDKLWHGIATNTFTNPEFKKSTRMYHSESLTRQSKKISLEDRIADLRRLIIKKGYYNELKNTAAYKQFFYNSSHIMNELLPHLFMKKQDLKTAITPENKVLFNFKDLADDNIIKRFIRSVYLFIFLHESMSEFIIIGRLIMDNTFFAQYKIDLKINDTAYIKYIESILSIHHAYYPPLMLEQFRFLFLEVYPYYNTINEKLNYTINDIFSEAYNILSGGSDNSSNLHLKLLECAPIKDVVADIVELFKKTKALQSYESPEVDFDTHTLKTPYNIPDPSYLELAESIEKIPDTSEYTPTSYAPVQTIYPNGEVLHKYEKYLTLNVSKLLGTHSHSHTLSRKRKSISGGRRKTKTKTKTKKLYNFH